MAEDLANDRRELIDIDVFKLEDPPIILHPDDTLEDLRELAESIKKQGLIQPITVRPKGDHYQIISGHRRVKAAKQFGITTLTARILNRNDKQALIAASTENIQRLDQDPIQEAILYEELRTKHNTTEEDIAAEFGKSRQYVRARLKLLLLQPLIQDFVKDGSLTIGAAQALTKCPNPDDQLKLAVEMKGTNMTIDRAEHFVKTFLFYQEKYKDAPQQEIIEEALKPPTAVCPECGETKDVQKFTAIQCCSACKEYFIFLKVKDRTGGKTNP